MKKLLIGFSVAVALGVALLVGLAIVIDPAKVIDARKDALLKDVSARIGREVTAQKVETSLGWSVHTRVSLLRVAGATPQQRAMLELSTIDVQLSLWRAVLTLGKELYVEQFAVNGLVVRLARDPSGRWDFQDILDRLEEQAAAQPSTGGTTLDGTRVASASLNNARIELNDASVGRPVAIASLNVSTSDVVGAAPLTVVAKGVLEDGARKNTIDVAVHLKALPSDLNFAPLPELQASTKFADVDLAPWVALLPAHSAAPVSGTLSADVQLHVSRAADSDVTLSQATAGDEPQTFQLSGKASTRALVLRDAIVLQADGTRRGAQGQPIDLDIVVKAQRTSQGLHVEQLDVSGSGLNAKLKLDTNGDGFADLKSASVNADAADVSRLLMALPPSLRGLPAGVRVDGPARAQLTTKGDEIAAELTIDGARVRLLDTSPDAPADSALFDKAAGKTMRATLHAKRDNKTLSCDRVELAVDTVRVAGTATIDLTGAGGVSADINSGDVSMASLQGVLPPFRDALGRGQRVSGLAQVKLKAQMVGGVQQADAAIELRDIDVNLASTLVRGAGALTLKAAPTGGNVAVTLSADLDGFAAQHRQRDGTLDINKPAGMPLRLDAVANKSKTRADISKLALAIGTSTISGTGALTNLDQRQALLHLDLGKVALAFDDLRATIPGAASLPMGGRFSAGVVLDGPTAALGIALKDLVLAFGSSRVQGNVNVNNLSAPTLDVNLSAIDVGFDDVRGIATALGDLPKGGRFRGNVKIVGDTRKAATVSTKVGIDALTMPNGAKLSTLKGSLEFINLDRPQFAVNLDGDSIDVDALRAAFGSTDDDKQSTNKASNNPHGLSRETRALLANVSGTGTLRATTAVLKGMHLRNFRGELAMTRGRLRFDKLEFGFYGGSVSANGTALDLPAERLGYDINFDGKDIDVGALLADISGLGPIFKGTVSPKVDVTGRGVAGGDFAVTAEGPASLKFRQLSLNTLDLLGPIGDALSASKKLPGTRLAKLDTKGTTFEAFTALAKFLGGKWRLEKPLEVATNVGALTLTGGAGFNSALDFTSTLQIPPDIIAKMTGNAVKLKNAVPVPLHIGGTWDKPKVSGVDVAALVREIVKDLGGAALKDGQQAAQDAIKGALSGAPPSDKKSNKKDKGNKSNTDKAVDAAAGVVKGLRK